MNQLLNSSDSPEILKIFEKVSQKSEAYQDFLKQRGLKVVSSVEGIPVADKENYFKKYNLGQKIYRDKELSDYYMICSSSGSTGVPTFWPRDLKRDKLAEKGHTAFLDEHFQVLTKKSLIVVALDLGTTTAGLMHTRLSWDLSEKSDSTIITPGCKPDKAASMIENLYKYYDQVILLAYPTLVNEIIDYALVNKFDFDQWHLKLGYTGSGANEIWRLELIKKYGFEAQEIISFYGCTEVGFIGVESKVANNLINVCLKNKSLIKKLFHTNYLPTIVDNLTPQKFFEVIEDELIVTVDQPIPLVRYNLHDKAAIVGLKQIRDILNKEGLEVDLSQSKNDNWLVIYGRRNNTRFSTEEVKKAFYLSSPATLLKEFQYREERQAEVVKMHFVFYLKRGKTISNQETKELKNNLAKIFAKEQKSSISLEIKEEEKRIGYQSGKLTYFI